MADEIGRRIWVIPEGYIPGSSATPHPSYEMISHEAACILNPNDQRAHVEITVYFTDRGPAGPYRVTVDAQRTNHLRFNDLAEPESIPRDTPYSSVFRSDVPIVVQHTRLDSSQPAHTVLTTIAWAM
jgi:hypothetical protein